MNDNLVLILYFGPNFTSAVKTGDFGYFYQCFDFKPEYFRISFKSNGTCHNLIKVSIRVTLIKEFITLMYFQTS